MFPAPQMQQLVMAAVMGSSNNKVAHAKHFFTFTIIQQFNFLIREGKPLDSIFIKKFVAFEFLKRIIYSSNEIFFLSIATH